MAIRDLEDTDWGRVTGGFGAETLGERPNCTIPFTQGKLSVLSRDVLSRDLLEPYIHDAREHIPEVITPAFNGLYTPYRPVYTPYRPGQRHFTRIDPLPKRRLDTERSVPHEEKLTHQPVTLSWKMPYLNR